MVSKAFDAVVQLKGDVVIVPAATGWDWNREQSCLTVYAAGRNVHFNLDEVVYIAREGDVYSENPTYNVAY